MCNRWSDYMNSQDLFHYVKLSAQVAKLHLSDEQAQRVCDHLERTLQMAHMLEACDMPVDVELAQMFVPAPFPEGTHS